jgi:hypothetical protein
MERRFENGAVVDETAIQDLLDEVVYAASAAGASTGVLMLLRDARGSLDDTQRHLAAIESRLATRWLGGSPHAATLKIVASVLAVPGPVRWQPNDR